MHLLAAKPGEIQDGRGAVDLGQSPGDIVFLTAADTELNCLSAAQAALTAADPATASLRLANLTQLGHNLSVDLYLEKSVAGAKLVVVRLLGGIGYWPYGVEQLVALARERGIALALLPGDDKPDPALAEQSTLPRETLDRLWRYCVEGGVENAGELLRYAAHLIGRPSIWREPRPLLRAGYYWPGLTTPDLAALRAQGPKPGAPAVLIVFYRALMQAGETAPIDALIEALAARGLNALPIYLGSLKDEIGAALIEATIAEAPPDLVLNATAFALGQAGAEGPRTPFDAADCPVFQVVLSSGDAKSWRAGSRGLSARDIAMHVALPEIDGRILTRAISFKAEARFDPVTEAALASYRPEADRVAFLADLAAAWARLRRAAPAERRLALILANYPNRDGRIANGVGLDVPASLAIVLGALRGDGYDLGGDDAIGDALDGAGLMQRLLEGPTNQRPQGPGGIRLDRESYGAIFAALPVSVREAVTARWGAPERDPFFDGAAFRLPGFVIGNVAVAIQPARGYNIDPTASYHDPALVPPHGYIAFYGWLRRTFGAHALIHLGKHGNLEWLPGKALALSAECYPEAVMGALPHFYPFIVNDPGEGSQAKRRTAAVILDHLTPPLTRAESYGEFGQMENLVDEYYEAAGLDPRRCRYLAERILETAQRLGLDRDCGIAANESTDSALAKIDAHLCDLKELQIRDGLHIFGRAPEGELATDLLVALLRLPRGRGEGGDASLLRALATDLGLSEGFDPLSPDFAAPWAAARPDALASIVAGPWRHQGDTVERLEALAQGLVAGRIAAPVGWPATRAVLAKLEQWLRPLLEICGAREIEGLLRGLGGRFVAPGASGAPTRGRLEVLPTGRNFYSIDSRALPTPAAWALGWKSAQLLLERYRQDHGVWPKSLALSAWGTANMRTGGDDIAQALALMGVQPRWETGSGRITGFEIMPLSLLDRPRIDVTFRISGFFRDAFPAQIDLLDSAVRAVAALDELPDLNPLAAKVKADRAQLEQAGASPEAARQRAGFRIFGSKPGAYGAGLQALIDEKGWKSRADLAEAYLVWGAYAYGDGQEGAAARGEFEARLGAVDAVLHNQDNREHDLLDSDDYYQFEGGLAAAVETLRGRAPSVYHNDHARPETPKIRRLEEEIGRVVRGRAANPKWIAGVMRHGYKGAFEIAATVDYLFAFAATTHAVQNQHFDALYDAYLADPAVRAFIEANNPAAARETAAKFEEAIARGLWRPRSNSVHRHLADIKEGRR